MNIKISNSELKSMGCINCIWKNHNQCPYSLDENKVYDPKIHTIESKAAPDTPSGGPSIDPANFTSANECNSMEGICPDYLTFLLSFAEEGDSINALWEKFSLYVARLQSLNDYSEFLKLRDEIKDKGEMSLKEKISYDIQLNTLRLWWERLNDTVRKGYGKIADREGREQEGKNLPGIMNARTINFNIGEGKTPELENKEAKQIEEKKK